MVAIDCGHVEVVRALLAAGASVEMSSVPELTPLVFACRRGSAHLNARCYVE